MGILQVFLRLFQKTRKVSKYAYKLPCGRYIDPLHVYKLLLKNDINKYIEARKTKNELQYVQAEINLCTVIRDSFDIPSLSKRGEGYTEQDTLDLLADFLGYIEKKDEKEKTLVTSPQHTATIQENLPANNDCGCT